MVLRSLALAGVMAIISGLGAQAQGLRGPAEQPPAGFTGQQYVDSRGCVFLRAGVAGTTNWVPRVSRDRRPVCGQIPSFTPEPPVMAEAPRPAPRRAGDPIDTIASITTPPAVQTRAAPRPAPAPAAQAQPAPVAAPAAAVRPRALADGRMACPASAPYLGRFALAAGGTTLLCSDSQRSFASLAGGWRVQTGQIHAPIEPAVTPRRGAAADTRTAGVRTPAPSDVAFYAAQGAQSAGRADEGSTRFRVSRGDTLGGPVLVGGNGYNVGQPTPPKGWRNAWTDDRLNPKRGVGTAAGQAAQDQVWTRDVPARPVADAGRSAGADRRVVVSTSGGPQAGAPVASGRFFVQVGSYGVPENAQRSTSRLTALGLPAAVGRATIKGKPVQVVQAGPFATRAEAQAALSRARGAGFGDAFIR